MIKLPSTLSTRNGTKQRLASVMVIMKYFKLIFLICIIPLIGVSPAEAIAPEGEPPLSIQEYAELSVCHFFGCEEWEAFNKIVIKESNWKSQAQNTTSTAFGLGQFLNSTWQTVGYKKTDDPYIQLDAMVAYIKIRYGTPTNALVFHVTNSWY